MSLGTILVVEDDPSIRRGQVDALKFAGYSVHECEDGGEALTRIAACRPDLVLLDVVLPNRSGFEILEDLRRSNAALPVILVTARGGESDRVHGLKEGADDYVVKPFSARELLARVEAVLRRSPARPRDSATLRHGGREISFERAEVLLADGERRSLSEKECAVLQYLANHVGRVVAREELLQQVWGLDPRGLETRTIDMHVARLREKLGESDASRLVETVRGRGYTLSPDAEVQR